jgi:hypothetical protein
MKKPSDTVALILEFSQLALAREQSDLFGQQPAARNSQEPIALDDRDKRCHPWRAVGATGNETACSTDLVEHARLVLPRGGTNSRQKPRVLRGFDV